MTVDAVGPVERSRFAIGKVRQLFEHVESAKRMKLVPIWLGVHVHDYVWTVPDVVLLCCNLQDTDISTSFCANMWQYS
jgi:hypothetical protein